MHCSICRGEGNNCRNCPMGGKSKKNWRFEIGRDTNDEYEALEGSVEGEEWEDDEMVSHFFWGLI